MKDLDLAKYMHDKYEEISKRSNWKTQKKCQVEFDTLPKENQQVMMELATDLNQKFNNQEKIASNWIAKLLNEAETREKAIDVLIANMPRDRLIKIIARGFK